MPLMNCGSSWLLVSTGDVVRVYVELSLSRNERISSIKNLYKWCMSMGQRELARDNVVPLS